MIRMADNRSGNNRPICKQCTTPIERDADSVACEGFCHNVFHIICAKLHHEIVSCCRSTPNIWWLCNQCTPLMREMRNERILNTKSKSAIPPEKVDNPKATPMDEKMNYDKEICELKRQIGIIQENLSNASIAKATDESFASLNLHPPIARSSPLSSPQLLHGTKQTSTSNVTAPTNAPGEKFWLFFTRIKNDVTELTMSRMVQECLSSDAPIEVKMLVPAWKNPSMLPYISFKIGIDVNFKEAALRSSTWPVGLCFREFRNCVWEPIS